MTTKSVYFKSFLKLDNSWVIFGWNSNYFEEICSLKPFHEYEVAISMLTCNLAHTQLMYLYYSVASLNYLHKIDTIRNLFILCFHVSSPYVPPFWCLKSSTHYQSDPYLQLLIFRRYLVRYIWKTIFLIHNI